MTQQKNYADYLIKKLPFIDIIFGTHNLDNFRVLLEEKLKATGKDYFFAEGKDLIPISKFNEVNELNKELNKQIASRDSQLTEQQKAVKGNEELTKQIKDLQDANKKAQSEYESEVLRIKKDSALKLKLSQSGAKSTDALLGMISKDVEGMEFKDDNYVGLDEKIAQIKKDNAWLFEEAVPQSGGQYHYGNPPSGDEFSELRKL